MENAGYSVGALHRTIMPLFSTEIGVHEADYPSTLVQKLRNDPDAQTYQYVASGVPHEWAESSVEDDDGDLRLQLESALGVAREAQDMCIKLFEQIELQSDEIDRLRGELGQ